MQIFLIILAIYCTAFYAIGISMFCSIVEINGGIDSEALKRWDFWGLVALILISPISIPFFAFKGN